MRKRIVLVLTAIYLLTGCAGVEPERRAYPLVLGIDWQEGRYQMIYGMADLSAFTGQDKSGESEVGKNTILFEGETVQEILQMYDRTQERYLDLGHIQAVIFGERLLNDNMKYEDILNYLEGESAVGDSAAVFRSGDHRSLLELNGSDVESLGMYLTGLYENRLQDRRDEMVTLRSLYRSQHEEEKVPPLPDLDVKEDFPRLSA